MSKIAIEDSWHFDFSKISASVSDESVPIMLAEIRDNMLKLLHNSSVHSMNDHSLYLEGQKATLIGAIDYFNRILGVVQ